MVEGFKLIVIYEQNKTLNVKFRLNCIVVENPNPKLIVNYSEFKALNPKLIINYKFVANAHPKTCSATSYDILFIEPPPIKHNRPQVHVVDLEPSQARSC